MSIVEKSVLCKTTDCEFGFDLVSQYLLPNRPWLTLYGARVRCVDSRNEEKALIQQLLPHQIILQLFSRLGPYGRGAASCVCREWYIFAQNPFFWYKACLEAFSMTSLEENVRLVKEVYCCSWKRMFLCRPHLRFDGVYVARNSYLRPGISDWVRAKPVHLVTYFRYLRFWPNGNFRYCTTPSVPQLTASFLDSPLHHNKKTKKPRTFMNGMYVIDEGDVRCVAYFPATPWIQFQIHVNLISTTIGANNRLEVKRISTTDTREFEEEDFNATNPNEENIHQRGLAAFIFIPWDKIDQSPFNKPQDMDYNITGVLGTVQSI